MQTFTLVVFKESETELDALFSLNERYEHISHKTYTDIGEAYEKFAIEQSRGNKAILLSDSLITELAPPLGRSSNQKKVDQVLFSE